jgi:Protein of unknown function (DUF3617)
MWQLRFTVATVWSLVFVPVLIAQTPTTAAPPIQWGLWHEETVTTITGIDGVRPIPQKDTEQFCISPESWQRFGLQVANQASCSISNRHQDVHNLSYDVICSRPAAARIIFHMNILIDSDRHVHGTAVATISAPGSSQHGTWTSSVTERYIAPDCGGLKSGEKTPLKQ